MKKSERCHNPYPVSQVDSVCIQWVCLNSTLPNMARMIISGKMNRYSMVSGEINDTSTTKAIHLLIGLGVPILSIPVTLMIPGIWDLCKYDFGSGCNEVNDGVFTLFFFLPFLVSLVIIFYSNRIEDKSLFKWAKISAILTFMYAVAMEFLMLVALQSI
jgi:hypothetical protein